MLGAGEQIILKTLGKDKRTHKVDGLELSSLHGNHCFSLDIYPQRLIPESKDHENHDTRGTETVALSERHSA